VSDRPDAPTPLKPIDPDSPVGQAARAGLAELFDDVADRLRREGRPVPDGLQ
jgi:hypothetical protein